MPDEPDPPPPTSSADAVRDRYLAILTRTTSTDPTIVTPSTVAPGVVEPPLSTTPPTTTEPIVTTPTPPKIALAEPAVETPATASPETVSTPSLEPHVMPVVSKPVAATAAPPFDEPVSTPVLTPRIVTADQLTTPSWYRPETLIPPTIINTPAVQHALAVMRQRYRLDDEHRTADRNGDQPRQGEPWLDAEHLLLRLLIATLGAPLSHWDDFGRIHGRNKTAIKKALSAIKAYASSTAKDVLGDDTMEELTTRMPQVPTVDLWRAAAELPPLVRPTP